jgi:hypothetical protein
MVLYREGGAVIRKSREQMILEARILRFAEEAFSFVKDFVAKLPVDFFDYISKTSPNLDTRTEVNTSYFLQNSSYISFSTNEFAESFGYNQGENVERLIAANIIFHEFAHYIQFNTDGYDVKNLAKIEDWADYFSGYLTALFLSEKGISVSDFQRSIIQIVLVFKNSESAVLDHLNRLLKGKLTIEDATSIRSTHGHAAAEVRRENILKGFSDGLEQRIDCLIDKFKE